MKRLVLSLALALPACGLHPLYEGGSSGTVARGLAGIEVAPMTPHLAEEAWAAMGETGLVADADWPVYDPALLVEDEVTIAVQVNGKLRDTLVMPKGSDKAVLEAAARANANVLRVLDGAEPKKVIVVPDRLVNLVA